MSGLACTFKKSRKQLTLQSPWSFNDLILRASNKGGLENQNCWDSSLKIARNGSINATFHSNVKHIHSNSFNVAPRWVLVLFRGCVEVFPRKQPSSGNWPPLLVPLWEGTTDNFLFAGEVNSLEKSQSKAFVSSRGVFLKDWMLSSYHHQPPNAVCRQVKNATSTSELAAGLQSKTLQFSEELRLQVLYKCCHLLLKGWCLQGEE